MTFVCLWSPRWSTAEVRLAELATSLLDATPRVVVDAGGVIWADGRGLPEDRLARTLLDRADWKRNEVSAGVAAVPVAAELAARAGDEAPLTLVEPGRERDFLAPRPLQLLNPDRHLRTLLEGVGIHCCGELAALEREGVEVRFGAEGLALWRLARADDPRRLFAPIPRERPHASMDFIEYEVRSAERLVFTANALLGNICATLAEHGDRAREMKLTLSLSGGGVLRERVRMARPTAAQDAWLRRIRHTLDRLRLPDAVSGVALEVEGREPVSAIQGDFFDRGFATAAPVEEAIARLIDAQGPLFVEPQNCAHPLVDRRTEWRAREPKEAVEENDASAAPAPTPGAAGSHVIRAAPSAANESPAALTLQLLPEPRRISVRVRPRRDHQVPVQYLEPGKRREWQTLVVAVGPERVSGGRWEEGYAREYFRCVTGSGELVWLFREAAAGEWFLHGRWD